MQCSRCGRSFWPRVSGYWFLLLAPRGRGVLEGPVGSPRAQDIQSVLCVGCGRVLEEYVQANAFDGLEFVKREEVEFDERRGSVGRVVVSHRDRDCHVGGTPGGDLVGEAERCGEAGVEGFRRVGECFPPGIG
jgi:hypothetical protein